MYIIINVFSLYLGYVCARILIHVLYNSITIENEVTSFSMSITKAQGFGIT